MNFNRDIERPSLKIPYPYNVLEWLSEKTDNQYEFSPYGIYDLVRNTLTEREQRVCQLRWVNGMTLEAIAKECGVTRERIRQIEAKACRKLTHPARLLEHSCITRKELDSLLKEKAMLEERLAKAEERIDALIEKVEPNAPKEQEVRIDPVLDMNIEELELSVRSYNCLKRWFAGRCNTVKDIVEIPEEEFYNIRNLGRKSAEEIIRKVHAVGQKMEWER